MLYNGYSSTIIGLTHPLVQFVAYEKMKLFYEKQSSGRLKSRHIFICSIVSKCNFTPPGIYVDVASLMTYPHEVLRARQQDIRGYDKAKVNLLNVIKEVHKKDGFRGFYAGFYVNLIKILPQNALLFVVYEYLRSHIKL